MRKQPRTGIARSWVHEHVVAEEKKETVQFPRGRLRSGLQKPSRKSICIDTIFHSSAGHNLSAWKRAE